MIILVVCVLIARGRSRRQTTSWRERLLRGRAFAHWRDSGGDPEMQQRPQYASARGAPRHAQFPSGPSVSEASVYSQTSAPQQPPATFAGDAGWAGFSAAAVRADHDPGGGGGGGALPASLTPGVLSISPVDNIDPFLDTPPPAHGFAVDPGYRSAPGTSPPRGGLLPIVVVSDAYDVGSRSPVYVGRAM